MPEFITVKIDVSKIDKTKLYQGKSAKYLDLVLIPKQSQYGDDYMVVQGLPKAERDQGVKGAILGNAKIMGQSRQSPPRSAPAPAPARNTPPPPSSDIDEDVPF